MPITRVQSEKRRRSEPALTLALDPNRQTVQFLVQFIEQWVSAFEVFVAIYSEKAP